MKIKDTTPKRHQKANEPCSIRKATARKIAMRAGHQYVSGASVDNIKDMYTAKIAETVRKLEALLAGSNRKTVKSADVMYVASSDHGIAGILPAQQ
tara:strand:+ start:474 stop:761 length:288 start_codon:yes stop_codon:yes gene_type:complete